MIKEGATKIFVEIIFADGGFVSHGTPTQPYGQHRALRRTGLNLTSSNASAERRATPKQEQGKILYRRGLFLAETLENGSSVAQHELPAYTIPFMVSRLDKIYNIRASTAHN